MSDTDFVPNFDDDQAPHPSEIDANEADVVEQSLDDLSQTPEDVDEAAGDPGYGDETATEPEDSNDHDGPDDYDDQ